LLFEFGIYLVGIDILSDQTTIGVFIKVTANKRIKYKNYS